MVTIPILNIPGATADNRADFSTLGDLASVFRKAEADRLKQQQDTAAQQLAAAGFAQYTGQPGPEAPQMPSGGGWLSQLLGLQQPQAAPQAAPARVSPATAAPAPQGDIVNTYGRQTSAAESGSPEGNYRAVGPPTRTGDRAYGRYQVTGENVGPWTEQYYGQRLTPREFLLNKDAQDAVYRGEFGRLVAKYGPEGAHRAWFAGEGGMNNPNASDGYHDMAWYMAKTGQAGGTPAPYQVASLAPVPPPASPFNTAGPGPQVVAQAQVAPPAPVQQAAVRSPNPPPTGEETGGVPTPPVEPKVVAGPPETAMRGQMSPEMFGALYANPNTRPLAAAILQKAMSPRDTELKEFNGNLYEYDKTSRAFRKIADGTDGHLATTEEKTNAGLDPDSAVWIDNKGKPTVVKEANNTELKQAADGTWYEYNKRTKEFRALPNQGTTDPRPATAEERQTWGDTVIGFGPDKKPIQKSGGTTVNMNQKIETEEEKLRSQHFTKFGEKIMNDAAESPANMSLLQQLHDLGSGIETGPTAAVQGWLSDRGLKFGSNIDKIEAYKTIANKMTPMQKIAGMGSITDFEERLFARSLPQLMNTPGGNDIIHHTLMSVEQYKQDRANIMQDYLAGGMTKLEAVQKIKALKNPYDRFKEAYNKGLSKADPAVQAAADKVDQSKDKPLSQSSLQYYLDQADSYLRQNYPKEEVYRKLREKVPESQIPDKYRP